ncbi:MAG: peptide deformylase [Oscillospiraceae bacterium]|nr:peptide deformylase [Oscillospiraceae bacterium]
MAIRTIVTEGDEILRKKCREVTDYNERLWNLLDDMAQTMHSADGAGLAAPQVGILRRIAVIDVGEGVIEFINPKIIEKSGSQTGQEGCLSCPGEWGIVERPETVKAEAFNRNGEKFVIEGSGLLARAMCHEFDHLDGILYKDIAIRMLEQDELESIGRKKLKLKRKEDIER